MKQKKLLIITGPMGSGNHMWSKIFALSSEVFGWKALLDTFWIGHDLEPFADYWRDPSKLTEFDWSGYDYFVTSISTPYTDNGERKIPKFKEFIQAVEELGISVELVVIGRDRNILGHQENRVRGVSNFELAVTEFKNFTDRTPFFLSYELLQLYQRDYLQGVNRWLQFPMDYNDPRIDEIINEDTNNKYFQPIEHHWVDDLAKHASRKWR